MILDKGGARGREKGDWKQEGPGDGWGGTGQGERGRPLREGEWEKQERKDTEGESVTAGSVYTYLGWTVEARMHVLLILKKI